MLRYRLGTALAAALASLFVSIFIANSDGFPVAVKAAVAAFGGAQIIIAIAYYAWPERSNMTTIVNVCSLFCKCSCGTVTPMGSPIVRGYRSTVRQQPHEHDAVRRAI